MPGQSAVALARRHVSSLLLCSAMCSTLHALEKKGLLPMEAELGKSTQREYQ